jgi:hypothetical protein
MKNPIIVLLALFFVIGSIAQEKPRYGPSVDFKHGRLKVHENRRYLCFEDGAPFFYLGDTGWELFHRLSLKDSEKYLENRRQKGFTVIQAVVLAEADGLNTPNAEGEKPLIDNDPLKPNEKYFTHVDKVVNMAADKGIFIGMLPTWGDKVDKARWGIGPVIFNPENAYKYGQWIGSRYKNFPNIIWIIGGDRSGGGENFAVWDAMARGIKDADKNHLMTFHPWGETSSSFWFHNCNWLDFNMTQTGHGQRTFAIYRRLLIPDYQRHPVKPCMDGEPRYEDHPVSWNPNVLGWFDDADVRQAAYWSLFSGAHGHTYGCHAIWQMLAPGREPIGFARNTWYDDLDLPGAFDMLHVRNLIESRPFFSRIPDQTLIANEYVPETDMIVATRGEGYAMVYIPTGWTADVRIGKLGFKKIRVWWYDPRTGEAKDIGIISGEGIQSFTPPSSGRGNDWILVLDDAEMNFNPPGAKLNQ